VLASLSISTPWVRHVHELSSPCLSTLCWVSELAAALLSLLLVLSSLPRLLSGSLQAKLRRDKVVWVHVKTAADVVKAAKLEDVRAGKELAKLQVSPELLQESALKNQVSCEQLVHIAHCISNRYLLPAMSSWPPSICRPQSLILNKVLTLLHK
jgi:hypothetical protein